MGSAASRTSASSGEGQSELTYNLIAGLNWRFAPVASAFVGWRYMHVDIERGTRLGTLDTSCRSTGHSSASTSTSEGPGLPEL